MKRAINQYMRDMRKLLTKKQFRNRIRLYFIYHRLIIKNIFTTKLFKIKTNKDTLLGLNFYYDNFNSFFGMFTEIFIHNIYDFKTKEKAPVIFDCGANIGIATLYFKYRFPESKVEAFEPDRKAFELLKKNVQMNRLKDVNLHNVALGDKNGEITLYSHGDFEGCTGNTMNKEFINFPNVQENKVKMIPLSSIKTNKITYLKLDIEGEEDKVLWDMNNKGLLKKTEQVCLEYHYNYQKKENKLSKVIKIIEEEKFHYIININLLNNYEMTIKDYKKNRNRYVLMINCFR